MVGLFGALWRLSPPFMGSPPGKWWACVTADDVGSDDGYLPSMTLIGAPIIGYSGDGLAAKASTGRIEIDFSR